MLKTILFISGRPGLFRLVAQGKNMLIVESVADKKKIPAYHNDKVTSLGDISIYTNSGETPLYQVMTNIQKKEKGEKASIPTSATANELRDYMAEILPDFDRERVYPSDIRKIVNWYNILIADGFTSFAPKEEGAPATEESENSETTK